MFVAKIAFIFEIFKDPKIKNKFCRSEKFILLLPENIFKDNLNKQ